MGAPSALSFLGIRNQTITSALFSQRIGNSKCWKFLYCQSGHAVEIDSRYAVNVKAVALTRDHCYVQPNNMAALHHMIQYKHLNMTQLALNPPLKTFVIYNLFLWHVEAHKTSTVYTTRVVIKRITSRNKSILVNISNRAWHGHPINDTLNQIVKSITLSTIRFHSPATIVDSTSVNVHVNERGYILWLLCCLPE